MKIFAKKELRGVVAHSAPSPATCSEYALVDHKRGKTIAYLEEAGEGQGIDLASLIGASVSIKKYAVDTSEDTGEVPLISVNKGSMHVLAK